MNYCMEMQMKVEKRSQAISEKKITLLCHFERDIIKIPQKYCQTSVLFLK